MADKNQDVAQAWKGFDETRRKSLLAKMTPDQKKNLRSALEGTPSFSDISKLTENPKGERLYRMVSPTGKSPVDANGVMTSSDWNIPYSRVKDALNAGYNLHPDETQRYQKDTTHEGEGPTLLERAKTRIQNLLEPSKGVTGQIPVVPGLDVNAVKAAGRVVAGTPGYLADVADAALRSRETGNANELLNLIDPTQMPKQMYDQFREDYKKDPQLAADNLTGTLAGLGLVSKATHGAQEKVGNLASKGIEAVTKTPRATLEAITDTSPRQIREMADEVKKKNDEATQKAAEINKKAQEEHEVKKQEAEHATKGREIGHKYDIHQKAEEQAKTYHEEAAAVDEHNSRVHDKAAKKYAQDVKDVRDANQKTVEKYNEEKNRIEEENKAADYLLELRRAEEAKLEKDTTDYYAKEDAVKSKVKGDVDAKWTPLHQAIDSKTIDGGFIEKPLEKIIEISPEVRREINQLIPDPDEVSSDSQYAQDRSAIMKSQGITGSYWDLNPDKRAIVDSIASSSGLTPEPIDLDPKAGVGIPFDKVHRAQSIIGRNIRNGRYGYEGPLLGEMKQLQKILYDAENKIATDNGLSSALNDARKATREYQEAFGRARNTPKNQVDLRKQQANPEQFKEENEQERVEAAKQHDPSLAEDYEKVKAQREKVKKMKTEDELRKSIQQVPLPPTMGDLRPGYKLNPFPVYEPPTIGDIRDGYRLKPRPLLPPAGAAVAAVKVPERVSPGKEPIPVAPETKPIGAEDYGKRKVEHIKAAAKSLRSMGLRRAMYATMTGLPFAIHAAFIQSAAQGVEGAISGMSAGAAVLAGSHLIADLVERPDVSAWLSKVTDKDVAEFNKLPPEQKALFTEDMKQLGKEAQKKGIKVSPSFSAFVGIGAAKQSAKKSATDELKDKARELQDQMHKSGVSPAPSTGVTQ